jgi:hypothetical protein
MILFSIILIVLAFGTGAILGAPYLPILRRDSELLLSLANLKAGQRLIDLGSGDGRLLKAAAKQGVICIGYEINPILYVISRIVTWPEHRLVTIHLANFWYVRLPETDMIYVFMLDKYMVRLAMKLKAECRPSTELISYIFKIPNIEPTRSTYNTYVYRVAELEVLSIKS